ncbi:hypothetical protein Bca52824_080171 [Brassica carinata]|uniref:Uncharacterized protein n=1 Tax=Brassica carinata TaxID=52824 RepID=A0A8X7Q1G2_BRACI|nr:hypothetical protein Bca52824_080171 [Brassica carinata]
MSFKAFSPPPCSSFIVPSKALSPPEPPYLQPCSPFPVLFEALSPTEPPDPPDASFRLVVHLHFDTPFTLSQAFSKIQNLEAPFPNLTSGGVVSFVFFGATRIGSKGLCPAVCSVLLADVLSRVVTVLHPFMPSPQALTHISTLKPPSRMATKNVGGGGFLVSASNISLGLLFLLVKQFVLMYSKLYFKVHVHNSNC